jgi:hypothetical protein
VSILTVEEVKALVEQPKGICVSIYMPTVVAGPEVRQNAIRFKNLVKQSHQKLVENGFDEDAANEFLRPMIEDVDRGDEFWENQSKGLAIFITEGFHRYYKVPRDLFELVVVTEQVHLKPLLPLLTGDGTFYVLELSQKQVKLFEGDRYSIREVDVNDLPQNMAETLQYDETAADGQFRIGTTSGASNVSNSSAGAGVFHGQGASDRDDVKRRYDQFFHAVDRALHEFLRDKRSPLVLACVEYLMPIYRGANTYPHLLEEGITGNVKIEKPEELHAEAWSIVEPHFIKAQEDAAEYYRNLSSTDLISTQLEETVAAAYYGRVEQLFVPVGVQRWGKFDAMANEVQIHSEAQPGDEDLLDAAAIQTLINGGIVYAVELRKMPDEAPIAAVFRY